MKWLLRALVLFALIALPAAQERPDPFFVQLADPQPGVFTGSKDFAQETANYEFAVVAVNRLRPA